MGVSNVNAANELTWIGGSGGSKSTSGAGIYITSSRWTNIYGVHLTGPSGGICYDLYNPFHDNYESIQIFVHVLETLSTQLRVQNPAAVSQTSIVYAGANTLTSGNDIFSNLNGCTLTNLTPMKVPGSAPTTITP